MGTELKHKFEYVEGGMDIEDIEIISVVNRKYARVDLCIKLNANIPFARIKLYSRDRYLDAIECLDSAEALGKEIERRWGLPAENEELKEKLKEYGCHKAGCTANGPGGCNCGLLQAQGLLQDQEGAVKDGAN